MAARKTAEGRAWSPGCRFKVGSGESWGRSTVAEEKLSAGQETALTLVTDRGLATGRGLLDVCLWPPRGTLVSLLKCILQEEEDCGGKVEAGGGCLVKSEVLWASKPRSPTQVVEGVVLRARARLSSGLGSHPPIDGARAAGLDGLPEAAPQRGKRMVGRAD